ncbi:hypothetical protein [Actinosynnema sp. ALI-1.44]|uniref:hypothetical protein n=1 Tax=Actinosynnema sp. ALI-1.44 TaxID=1933779 RepID=UPI00117889ED|nr:hypothetical protein [Actinosynnema sp. ALI-1.44]
MSDLRELPATTVGTVVENESALLALRLARELAMLRATADRSDPVDETMLCLAECVTLTAGAVEQIRRGTPEEKMWPMFAEAAAAARAAVLCATYALAED